MNSDSVNERPSRDELAEFPQRQRRDRWYERPGELQQRDSNRARQVLEHVHLGDEDREHELAQQHPVEPDVLAETIVNLSAQLDREDDRGEVAAVLVGG